jgi:general secretion pathway protein I
LAEVASGASSSSDQAGFTLLEVIVAIAILALSFTMLFQTIAETIDRAGEAAEIGKARVVAQSLLAQVGRQLPMKAGESVGDESGFHWRLRQSPYREGEDGRATIAAMQLSAEVSWGRPAHSLTISTLRINHARTR